MRWLRIDRPIVTASLIIFPAGHARELQLLGVGGFLAGVATFIYGIRLRATRPSAQNAARLSDHRPLVERMAQVSVAPAREMVRLPSEAGPTRSADMTQQQKIAAALTRAGMSQSLGWETSEPGIAVENLESVEGDTPSQTPIADVSSSYTSTLLLWCGSAMAMAGIVLLVFAR